MDVGLDAHFMWLFVEVDPCKIVYMQSNFFTFHVTVMDIKTSSECKREKVRAVNAFYFTLYFM